MPGIFFVHELVKKRIRCVILAPATMLAQQGKRIKTDKRDALMDSAVPCLLPEPGLSLYRREMDTGTFEMADKHRARNDGQGNPE